MADKKEEKILTFATFVSHTLLRKDKKTVAVQYVIDVTGGAICPFQ